MKNQTQSLFTYLMEVKMLLARHDKYMSNEFGRQCYNAGLTPQQCAEKFKLLNMST